MITFAQGWPHASAQLLDDRNFIVAIVLGLAHRVGCTPIYAGCTPAPLLAVWPPVAVLHHGMPFAPC